MPGAVRPGTARNSPARRPAVSFGLAKAAAVRGRHVVQHGAGVRMLAPAAARDRLDLHQLAGPRLQRHGVGRDRGRRVAADGVADRGEHGPLVGLLVAEVERLQADHVGERAALRVERRGDVVDRAGDLARQVAGAADAALRRRSRRRRRRTGSRRRGRRCGAGDRAGASRSPSGATAYRLPASPRPRDSRRPARRGRGGRGRCDQVDVPVAERDDRGAVLQARSPARA